MRLNDSPDHSAPTPVAAPRSDTKARILRSAVRLFAKRGFDVVSVREITEDAKVNPAAISYHFGSKEGLIRTAIGLVFAPVNRERLHALKQRQQAAVGRPLDLEAVVDALITPSTYAVIRSESHARYYARFSVLAYALRDPAIDAALAQEHDIVARSFIEAFSAALPDIDRERICWCYDFAVGAIVHVLLDRDRGHRLAALSNGLCDTDDPDQINRHLRAFIVGGMRARLADAASSRTNGAAASQGKTRQQPARKSRHKGSKGRMS